MRHISFKVTEEDWEQAWKRNAPDAAMSTFEETVAWEHTVSELILAGKYRLVSSNGNIAIEPRKQ